ncbi:MAG TPA: HAD family phosphatase [Prolixibacteraceae bacterium]|nr:HAD family phosphatase [Prolixibacteraceae bacterium]
MKIENIIFDFGGVLVDWNPRHLYRNYFANEADMEHFLQTVCNDEWNIEQDRGRSLADGTRILQEKFPEYHDLIALYYGQWETMLKCEIPETVALMYELKERYGVYGLTNWSGETITIAYARYAFFKDLDGIVVSSEEKLIKPDKRLYQILLNRYALKAESCVFIDDNLRNVKAAEELGMAAIHFINPQQLKADLSTLGVL